MQTGTEAVGKTFNERGWKRFLVTDPWHTFRANAMAHYILRESLAYYRWRLTGESGSGGINAF
jgi:hypothetical protein